MEIVATAWHVISAFLIFIIGAVASAAVGHRFKSSFARSLTIYAWHTVFCFVYGWYVLTYGGDALGYFNAAQIGLTDFSLGTAGVSYLTTLLVQGFGVSLLGAFLSFNIFGSIGLIAFDACLRIATQDKKRIFKRLATLIIFLPSVSFWSSAIGKDSLSFMATGLALWASLNLGRRGLLMAFSVLIMLLVRPHMAGLMTMGLAVAIAFDDKAPLARKVLFTTAALICGAALVPFALRYAGVGDTVDATSLMNYIEERQRHNMGGGGGVDISAMSFPVQLFTYMFRPTFFEVRSVFALAAALDNLILLYLFIAGGYAMLKGRKATGAGNRVFMWTYALMAWAILAMTSANLGIALRQKWMFAPMLVFLLISVTGNRRGLSSVVREPPVIRETMLFRQSRVGSDQ